MSVTGHRAPSDDGGEAVAAAAVAGATAAAAAEVDGHAVDNYRLSSTSSCSEAVSAPAEGLLPGNNRFSPTVSAGCDRIEEVGGAAAAAARCGTGDDDDDNVKEDDKRMLSMPLPEADRKWPGDAGVERTRPGEGAGMGADA